MSDLKEAKFNKASRRNSLTTILTFDRSSLSVDDWSVVWSTEHVPGMDNAAGGGGRRMRRGGLGRRRLWYGSFALGALCTMHVRVAAAVLMGGYFVYILFMLFIVGVLANPMRHFEIFLGQWSLSGPGRAFRIVPMLDGIGIAICINAIVRAICCVCVAAITVVYLTHTISDSPLPFNYCRDFKLQPYEPNDMYVNILRTGKNTFNTTFFENDKIVNIIGTSINKTEIKRRDILSIFKKSGLNHTLKIKTCKEIYAVSPLYRTPAYNFFFLEVMLYRPDYYFGDFNLKLAISLVILWVILWGGMIYERIRNKRLIWNNTQRYLIAIPCFWSLLVLITGIIHLMSLKLNVLSVFLPGSDDFVYGFAQATAAAMYIHSASVGTELIYGKGLNHYASGHIDPLLNGENILHSSLLLVLLVLNASGAAVCAVVDNHQPNKHRALYGLSDSALWMIPMYTNCISIGSYSHLLSTLLLGGLSISYTVVAYILLKSALHTIFEYRVKLVFVEQVIVAALIVICMLLSLLVATNGGLRLLEGVEHIMSGLAMSYICFIQLVAFIYAYRSPDFISDINIATEENSCATRISTQWKIIPFLTLVWFVAEVVHQFYPKKPYPIILAAVAPFVGILLAVPLRAAVNAYTFLRPAPRRGT